MVGTVCLLSVLNVVTIAAAFKAVWQLMVTPMQVSWAAVKRLAHNIISKTWTRCWAT